MATNASGTGQIRLAPSGTTGAGDAAVGVFRFYSTDPAESTALVPVRPDGTIEVVASHYVNLTLDITGFTRPAATYTDDTTGLRSDKQTSDGATTEFTWNRARP